MKPHLENCPEAWWARSTLRKTPTPKGLAACTSRRCRTATSWVGAEAQPEGAADLVSGWSILQRAHLNKLEV